MPELSGTTYSEVDGSNNQAAPSGMPEGMPPSGVNDAWRAGMGAIKRSYDRDHAGTWCTVGGTGNAVTLTYAVAPASYVQGEKYAFKAIAANSGATTVNVNGLGAKNVYKKSPSGAATACTGNEIQNGDLVEIEYDGTQFQLLSVAATNFVGGTLTATTTMAGAAFNEAAQVPLASAATTDIGSAASNSIHVTGGATITSLGSVVNGAVRFLYFDAGMTLTNNANIVLPGGANIVTGSADQAIFIGGAAWQCVSYSRGPASAATTLTGTDAVAFLTAAGFAGNKSLAANGYYKLPGGLIVQWTFTGSISGNSSVTWTYPVAFPNNAFAVLTSGAGGFLSGANVGTVGLSTAVIWNTSSNAQAAYAFAIGN
jgi:hypothetical protein